MLRITRTRTWVRARFFAMGSNCDLLIDGDRTHARDAIALVRRLEHAWSRFEPASELSELNRSNGRWFSASRDLFDAVRLACHINESTGGLFDATVLQSLVSLGYDRSFDAVERSTTARVRACPVPGMAGIALDAEHGMIRLPVGVSLDLGGVGKGLAADRVVATAVEAGARSACVSMGGDVAVAGEPSESDGWPIPIDHPIEHGEFTTVRLNQGGIVTSTTLQRTWRRGVEQLHHIIDPRTGRPSTTDVLAAIVVHDSTAWAEALAKAAIVAGSTAGLSLLSDHGATGWLMLIDGRLVGSLIGSAA